MYILPKKSNFWIGFQDRIHCRGSNIEDFKISLPKDKHRLKPNGIHTGNYADSWNGQWRQFFDAETRPRTETEILEQLEKMRKIFGI